MTMVLKILGKRVQKVLKKGLVFFLLVTLLGLSAPLATTQAKEKVYVNDNAQDKMDGSSKHPYNSIQKAINKAYDENKEVYVKKGTYTENIKIWEDVKVIGENEDKVVIKAKNDDEPTITMSDDAWIKNMTVTKGETGVYVKEGAGATIENCTIKNNKRDGIKAEAAKWKDSSQLIVEKSKLHNNGWNGIYSKGRQFYLQDDAIYDNEKDGVEFRSGSKGTFKDVDFKDNERDGLKIYLDDSKISIKKSSFKDNDREGLEVKSKGNWGFITVENNNFSSNDHWGIAKISKYNINSYLLNDNLRVDKENTFSKNHNGGISPIIYVD